MRRRPPCPRWADILGCLPIVSLYVRCKQNAKLRRFLRNTRTWRRTRSTDPILMRAAGWWSAFVAAAVFLAAASAVAQSRVETLPPVPGNLDGPPLDYFDFDAWAAVAEYSTLTPRDDWSWQLLPDGILYRAYLADPKESRIGTQFFNSIGDGALWDSTLGGHMGLV